MSAPPDDPGAAVHPLPHEGDRGEHMVRRVGRTAREAGVPEAAAASLDALHRLAMDARRRQVSDDRDPAFLHPGRTVLVLLGDAGARDLPLLAAGLLVDTERPELAPSADALDAREASDPGRGPALRAARSLAASVPRPSDEELAERLVTASRAARLLALAERLDQLRHAHLWDDREAAADAHRSARETYLPVAERTHPVMARRYAWWCRTFARRRG